MPTMAWAAGAPEIVGAVGAPTLTPAEPAPVAPAVRVELGLTPTWPQPARVAAESKQRVRHIARPRRALVTFIDTPCFNSSPSLVREPSKTANRRQRSG